MMTINPPRPGHPLFTRPTTAAPAMQLTERDLTILKLCFEHRFLDSDQIAALLKVQTQGARQRLRVRLQRLWQRQLVERPEDQRILRIREGYRPLIYALGHQGISILASRFGFDIEKIRWTQKHDQITAPFIKHALGISDFFTTLSQALRAQPEWAITDWRQGKAIFECVIVDAKAVSLRPDAFATLTHQLPDGLPRPSHFLIEYDLGSVREDTMAERYRRYWAYWKRINEEDRLSRGQLALSRQPNQPRALPIHKGFRVLSVTQNPTRAKNLCALARQADDDQRGSTMFYFTHRQWAIDNPASLLTPIWLTPADSQPRSLL